MNIHWGKLSTTERQRAFDWAAQHGEPLTVSLNRDGRLIVLRSSVVGAEPDRALMIAYPTAGPGEVVYEIAANERIGVSFRRGHKKCMFNTVVQSRCDGPHGEPCLMLAMPTDAQELPRRCYQRARVPDGRTIRVRIVRRGTGVEICRGQMRDLSAGGASIEIDSSGPTPGVNEPLTLEFDGLTPDGLRVDGALRHSTAASPGRISLGVQFIGLELTDAGMQLLRRIAGHVSDFRRPWSSRRGRGRADASPMSAAGDRPSA